MREVFGREMTGSESRTNVEDILAEFDRRQEMLAALCAKTKSLIEACLQDASIRYQSVQVRVKTRKKLREKYVDEKKDYRRLDDITDQAGLRIITYYEDEVDRVAEVITREFDIDTKNSVDKRNTEPDRFGSSVLNYVCKHLEKRTSDVEYKKFAGISCEIQVASILSHAWSEIEHDWYDLKEAYPDAIKRRFSRLAALLELAESEFLDIRKSRTQYERSVAVRVGANVPDLPVDAVSLKSFIEQEALVAEIDKSIASVLGTNVLEDLPDNTVETWSRAANLAGIKKIQDVRESLRKYKLGIPEYVSRCRGEVFPPHPEGARISRGLSIYHLSMMLFSLRGTEATTQFLKSFRYNPFWDVARQVAIAEEIVAKYSK